MFTISLPDQAVKFLVCPCCREALLQVDDFYKCSSSSCSKTFPIVNQVPVLINDQNSLFSVNDFAENKATTLNYGKRTVKKVASKFIPKIGLNLNTEKNYSKLQELIFQSTQQPVILIIGSGEIGRGLERIINDPNLTVVETDVYFSSRVQVIADGHDLPFQNCSFDAVICQAVLEHVINPRRCVAEMHRVLKANGLIYAETPFMQQVHMRAYDFTRFTLGGHRYLFRDFEQIDAGVVGGPGMTLAWSIQYFFLSFSGSVAYQNFCKLVLPFFIFWLKYFDYFLVNKPQASDAASGVFFLGKRSDIPVPDREIIQQHWTNKSKN